jgi:hypothetical protein
MLHASIAGLAPRGKFSSIAASARAEVRNCIVVNPKHFSQFEGAGTNNGVETMLGVKREKLNEISLDTPEPPIKDF